MKIRTIYERAVEAGKKMDPRGPEAIKEQLKLEKEHFEKLPKDEKAYYDKERLSNPYADTRIIFGDPAKEAKTIMVGIDVEIGEILLADLLNSRGEKIDLVITHHPEGRAYANFYEVMQMHTDIFAKVGVPVTVAEQLTQERQREVARNVSVHNHFRNSDVARILNVPLLTIHTPADNHVSSYLQGLFDKEKPRYVKNIIDIIKHVPEYEEAARNNNKPFILLGKEDNRAGKVFVDMTGGTEPSKEFFSKLAQAGVGTIVAMHVHEGHFNKAREEKINVIIAGHIASDTLGLNLLFDTVFGKDKIRFIETSGFRRFVHSKK